jgi:hypothetical protein
LNDGIGIEPQVLVIAENESEQAATGAKLKKKLRLQIARFSGCKSKLVEWPEGFHAVEFFGFPVHGKFQHGQAIGGGVEQFQLCGRVQIRRGFRGSAP